MSGDTGFAYINGADPYLVNFIQIGEPSPNKDEKSTAGALHHLRRRRHSGLTFMTHHVKGDNIDLLTTSGEGKEWERTWTRLRVPERPVEEPRGEVAQPDQRTNYTNDYDENRLIVSYTLPLW